MKIKVEMVKIFEVEVEAPEFLRPMMTGEKEFYELLPLTNQQHNEYNDWYEAVEKKYDAKFLDGGDWKLVEDV